MPQSTPQQSDLHRNTFTRSVPMAYLSACRPTKVHCQVFSAIQEFNAKKGVDYKCSITVDDRVLWGPYHWLPVPTDRSCHARSQPAPSGLLAHMPVLRITAWPGALLHQGTRSPATERVVGTITQESEPGGLNSTVVMRCWPSSTRMKLGAPLQAV